MIEPHEFDPIRLEVYKNLFAAIAEEMGAVLRKSSYSPNIKERRDFSCAVFNPAGELIAQAAHIPVHLGSMPLSVAACLNTFPAEELNPGDTIILNDPYRGGTHLPDITMVTPVFATTAHQSAHLVGFVASRAHHADVGGMAPGSMTIAREIYQEGIIIPPVKLFRVGELNRDLVDILLSNVRTPKERIGDLLAQAAANQRGSIRLEGLVERYGEAEVAEYMQKLQRYTERMTRHMLLGLRDGEYSFQDYLDDDGFESGPLLIHVTISKKGDQATFDFSGTSPQVSGSMNAVYAITLSAVYYVIRCLISLDVPNNSGCMIPIKIVVPEGSILNARHPSAVAGGNVETSQRIVDVLLGALASAYPDRIPAASQGTMNNVTIGGWDPVRGASYAYYETIGGGMGARPNSDGPSAVHSHMTNTMNTPVEAIEYEYPLRVLRYEIRSGTGGSGKFKGGSGLRRDIQVLFNAQVSLISERRTLSPYGLWGGEPGVPGENMLIRKGEELPLPGKGFFELQASDVISIRTPGGGGFGSQAEDPFDKQT